MADSVDFDNLRIITGGDAKLEAMLFASFLNMAEQCRQKMQVAVIAVDETTWRQRAHTLKGACLNLGATRLAELCDKAQMHWRAAQDEKTLMLQAIDSELQLVRAALRDANLIT